METIKHSYLMWIGSADYGTIEAWVNEATERGVSKRLPSISVGKMMLEKGTVIFVAHDEGEFVDCEHCQGEAECPACRKCTTQQRVAQAEIDAICAPYDGNFDTEAPSSKQRSVRLRKAKINQIQDKMRTCLICGGHGEYTTGTGGYVILKDGTIWDYRRYMYWRNQPKRWSYAEHVSETHMCKHCGGFGHIPQGVVFGCFVPEHVEYILSGSEKDKVADEIAEIRKITLVQLKEEPRRLCGKRRPGGTYVVTTKLGSPKTVSGVVDKLVSHGVITPDVEINGSFVKFKNPIAIDGVKRFRGIMRWHISPELEDEADLALDDID
jgi:hypothetical protein